MKVSEQVHGMLTKFRDAEGISTYSDAILVLLEMVGRVVNLQREDEGTKPKEKLPRLNKYLEPLEVEEADGE